MGYMDTLRTQALNHIEANNEALASRYGERKQALNVHSECLQADRIELVFLVTEWHSTQAQEDRKEYAKGKAIEDAAASLGDVSPKTVCNAAKLVALKTPENVLSQIAKIGYQATVDTCSAIGSIKALPLANYLHDHLTNTVQDCTKYWKRFATDRQARGHGIAEIVTEFNQMDKDSLKEEFTKPSDKVSREVYDIALAEIKRLKAENKALKAGMVPNGAPVNEEAPVAA